MPYTVTRVSRRVNVKFYEALGPYRDGMNITIDCGLNAISYAHVVIEKHSIRRQ